MSNRELPPLSNGIYKGVLQENVIDTIDRVQALYCDVLIEDFYVQGRNYPLTRIDELSNCIGLKKGDIVWVRFDFNDVTLPVIYRKDKVTLEGIEEKDNTKSFIKLYDNMYLSCTDNKIFIKNNDAKITIEKDKIIIDCKDAEINASGNVDISSTKCTINGHLEVL